MSSNIPAGRAGAPEEIAYSAVFLASDETSYITGANILVDGGMTSQLISQEPFRSKSPKAIPGAKYFKYYRNIIKPQVLLTRIQDRAMPEK
jgi:hypothetical protein